ncbi:MAG: ribosome maturation factor RimP [Eubacteriales bacterium]|jgi:ribosome maturation factor RimP|nr:ribosome maturation factor RimP [Eubacteriales bacterium]
MTGKKRKETARALLEEFLPAHGYELYNIKYVKDAGDWCLQVYIDKAGIPEGEYIGTADCELVSRYLSDRMDEEEGGGEKYYLIVSSPGLDRELFLPEHYERFKGKQADLKLYQPLDGDKEIHGVLGGIEDGAVIVERSDKETLKIPLEKIAKANLAVVF